MPFDDDDVVASRVFERDDGEIVRDRVVGVDAMQALLLTIASASSAMRYKLDGTSELRPPVRLYGEDDLGLRIEHLD